MDHNEVHDDSRINDLMLKCEFNVIRKAHGKKAYYEITKFLIMSMNALFTAR